MSVLDELQATVARQRAILSELEPGRFSGPDALALLGVFTDIERLGEAVKADRHLRTWTDGEGAFWGAFRTAPGSGARMLGALDAEIGRVFKTARAEGRREPRQAYAVDALETLMCAGAGGGGTARPKQ